MAESAEEIYARVVAAVGKDGHLPIPPSTQWDIFPWEVVDGKIAPKVLRPPAPEPLRVGESPDKPCDVCTSGFDPDRVVWEDENWVVTHRGQPSGLPVVVVLYSREHHDMWEMDDETAAQMGRISTRLVRIIGKLDNIGRVQVNRWADTSAHLHLWFHARPEGLPNVRGSYAVDWDDVLPPGPEHIWRQDLHTVGTKLANWAGHARA